VPWRTFTPISSFPLVFVFEFEVGTRQTDRRRGSRTGTTRNAACSNGKLTIYTSTAYAVHFGDEIHNKACESTADETNDRCQDDNFAQSEEINLYAVYTPCINRVDNSYTFHGKFVPNSDLSNSVIFRGTLIIFLVKNFTSFHFLR